MSGGYNKRYKKKKCLWGIKPSPIITSISKQKNLNTVLDLGSGKGRNSIFLAKEGFDVTAVDISKERIRKLRKLASKEKVKINSFVEDMKCFRFKENYDIIISTATLHFLEKEDIKIIIGKIKNHTNKNGYNIISVFTEENLEKNFPHLFKKGELKKLYMNWKIVSSNEYISRLEKHGNSDWHRHGFATIVAKKVN